MEHHRPSSSRKLVALLRAMGDGVVFVDAQGRITELTPAAEQLTGWRRAQALGRAHEEVLRLRGADGGPCANPLQALLAARQTAPEPAPAPEPQHCWLHSLDGRRLQVRMSAAGVLGDRGDLQGVACVITDLTDQALMAEELQHRASHDALTGLLNRESFERQLREMALRPRGQPVRHTLCYIDLDQFKLINDSLGHVAGDELLCQVATLFRSQLRVQDLLARLGGDEFGVLLRDCDLPDARAVVEDLLASLRDFRLVWGERAYSITASAGVTLLGTGNEAATQAMSQVDAACYAAKDAGRDRARFASDSDEVERRCSEMGMASRIAGALEQGRFMLVCEDVVRVAARREVVYRELLVRMWGDDGQPIAPGRFIPAAERYGLMTAVDRWVLQTALSTMAARGTGGVVHAVNVSGQSIGDATFLELTLELIRGSGIDPHQLCIEITETAAISHLHQAVHFMRELAALGVRFSLDDFGAGMASFAYLKSLPVDYLKIDGSFVRGMRHNRVDRGMVEALHRIGREMGLQTIAEHVEELSVLDDLAEIGVDLAQGRALGPSRSF